jgi:hypothetical protein
LAHKWRIFSEIPQNRKYDGCDTELTNLHTKIEADERHNNPELPRVDSKFSKRIGKAEAVHQSEGKSDQSPPLRRVTSDQIFDTDLGNRRRDQRFHDSPGQPNNVEGGKRQRD